MKNYELVTANLSPELCKRYALLLEEAGVRNKIRLENNGVKNTGKSFLFRKALEIALPILEKELMS